MIKPPKSFNQKFFDPKFFNENNWLFEYKFVKKK